jgi:hypothetical protein
MQSASGVLEYVNDIGVLVLVLRVLYEHIVLWTLELRYLLGYGLSRPSDAQVVTGFELVTRT